MASNAPTRGRVEINPNSTQAHSPELTAIHDKVLSQLDVMDDKLPAPLLWQEVVRRVMDSEPIDVVVSGSSAEMLSSEIASSLRGRAVEAVVYPFSFRESLRHAGLEPQHPSTHWSSAERSRLAHQLELYLHGGGCWAAMWTAPRVAMAGAASASTSCLGP